MWACAHCRLPSGFLEPLVRSPARTANLGIVVAARMRQQGLGRDTASLRRESRQRRDVRAFSPARRRQERTQRRRRHAFDLGCARRFRGSVRGLSPHQRLWVVSWDDRGDASAEESVEARHRRRLSPALGLGFAPGLLSSAPFGRLVFGFPCGRVVDRLRFALAVRLIGPFR